MGKAILPPRIQKMQTAPIKPIGKKKKAKKAAKKAPMGY